MNQYNDLLELNVGRAIKTYADNQNNYAEIYDVIKSRNYVSDEFIANNLEGILNVYSISHVQDYDFYIRVFKKVIAKYDMTADYKDYQINDYRINMKWTLFAEMIVDFITCSEDNVTIELFKNDIIRDYLSKFHSFFKYKDCFRSLRHKQLEVFLEIPVYQNEIINLSQSEINDLIINNRLSWGEIPTAILNHPLFIKNVAMNLDSEEYSAALEDLEMYNNTSIIDKYHDLFCDKIMQTYDHKKRYFPFLKEKYFGRKIGNHNLLSQIFISLKLQDISSYMFYQQLSKYIIIGFIFSRFFKTSRYNLSIDMKTLINYIDDPLREVTGSFENRDIYYKLINYKDTDINELVTLYNDFKERNIMHEFYDDWHKAQLEFVDELNSKALNNENLGEYNESLTNTFGVPIYELNGQDYYMIVRNTSIDANSEDIMTKLYEPKISRSYLSLSIHDQNHFQCFSREDRRHLISSDLKLIYGRLEEKYIGMIYPTDAYTNGISSIEIASDASRQLFSLKGLMQNTRWFNDISYVKTEELKPIAILCENEIIPEQLKAAQKLNVPILLRHNHLYTRIDAPSQSSTSYVKHYNLFKTKNF